MHKIQCYRCRDNHIRSFYEYEETREGGYDGAFSPLVRGHYHFYKCPVCGSKMAESSSESIRTEE